MEKKKLTIEQAQARIQELKEQHDWTDLMLDESRQYSELECNLGVPDVYKKFFTAEAVRLQQELEALQTAVSIALAQMPIIEVNE